MTDDSSADLEIGFVGIGNMGRPMAETLLRSEFSVTACDLREDALEAFEAAGGKRAENPADLGRSCQLVYVVVETDEQAEDVVYGDRGVFAGFEERGGESVLVIHSTVLSETVVSFSERAPPDTAVLDAAISGAPERAEKGDLALMIGGSDAVVEQYNSIFDALSREYYHLGPVGAGLAAKFANNMILYASAAATFEALEVGTAYGIDQDALLEVISDSTGDCYYVRNFEYLSRELWKTHPSGPDAGARLSRKTLYQALDLAADLDVAVPLTGFVSQQIPARYKEIAAELSADE